MKKRSRHGSGLVESIAMGVVLVLICLALIDLIVVVLANGINDTAAKNAARAAANQSDKRKAIEAAINSVNSSTHSSFVKSLTFKNLDYPDDNSVSCKTRMELNLPVPLPGIGGNIVFMAQSTEPVVAR